MTKAQLFRTAISKTSTANFNAGDFVAVKWYCFNEGLNWYLCSVTGKPEVCLSENWLEHFCL